MAESVRRRHPHDHLLAAVCGSTETPADLRLQVGLTRLELAVLLDVHPSTVEAWERRHRPMPGPARLLLLILAGAVPWPAWDGWECGVDGRLYPPGARDGFSAEDVLGSFWWRQLARHLQAQERRAQAMEAQPLPAQRRGGA